MAPGRIRGRAARANTRTVRGNYAPPSIPDDTGDHVFTPQVAPSMLKRKRDDVDVETWRVNKRDKRTIKHNTLLAKVRDAGIHKKPLKRRRPGKKLTTDIGSLADALPETEDGDDDDLDWEGIPDEEDNGRVSLSNGAQRGRKRVTKEGQGKMEMKSLRHRPGAMKRRMIIQGREIERFKKNLAEMVTTIPHNDQMSKDSGTPGTPSQQPVHSASSHSDRWAALRGFIGSTMQKDKAFTTT